MTAPVKIGFVLLSSARSPIPSTRIAVLNMFPFLLAAGYDPHIVFEPEQQDETPDVSGLAAKLQAGGFKVVYFQKVRGANAVKLANMLRTRGIRTVFGVCDIVEPSMVEATDATVVVTDYLKSLYPSDLQNKISVVHDGIECPSVSKRDWGSHRGSRAHPLRAVLVTSLALDRLPVLVTPPSWLHVTIVGRYPQVGQPMQRLREAHWQLAGQSGWHDKLRYLGFLANSRINCMAWDATGVYDAMVNADIGIIPVETRSTRKAMANWQVKSENRLTMKMAVGLPTVATPIPAYESVVRHGENGFLARDKGEWLTCLSLLRDPALRQRIGRRARSLALAEYSMERQAARLLEVLHAVTARGSIPQ